MQHRVDFAVVRSRDLFEIRRLLTGRTAARRVQISQQGSRHPAEQIAYQSMALSINLRRVLGIIFVQTSINAGGAFDSHSSLSRKDAADPALWAGGHPRSCQHFGNGLGLAIPAR